MQTGLIVDDAAVIRLRLKDILHGKYEIVAEAENGEQALELYTKYKPDFVTLDITMPKLNGIEVLKSITAKYPEARVVIVSAVGQKQLVFNALAVGAKDFIIKPFDPARVLEAINRLFSQ